MPMYEQGAWLGRVARLTLVGCCAAWFAGCAPEAKFHSNLPYIHRQEKSGPIEDQHLTDLPNILAAMFGTPDNPSLPNLGEVDISKVVDLDRVRMSAGRVKSDKSGQPAGLYREHCVHCHGITGNGLGPTAAFLNPYPRDFRKGIFKFKKTAKGQKPMHEDLQRILLEGVAGTAMPSFKVLDADERESLIHYIKYLALRGEVERKLAEEIVELDEGDRLIRNPADKDKDAAKYQEKLNRLRQIAAEVAQTWIDAETQGTPIPERTLALDDHEGRKAAIARGRELFYGPIANCVKCHGDSALGDGQLTDFDDWTKEFDPADSKALQEYLKLGALSPRNIRPRNLRLGIYRGGHRPNDLFWRITNGIDGTPMPAVPMKPQNEKGLTPDDVWDLVEYVRNLPYEALSKPDTHQATIVRDRM